MKIRHLGFLLFILVISGVFVLSCSKRIVKPDVNIISAQFLTFQYGRSGEMFFVNDLVGMMFTNTSVLKSVDGGISWSIIFDTSTLGYARNLDYINPDTAIVNIQQFSSPYNQILYRTCNGGVSWTLQSSCGTPFITSFYDGIHGFAYGKNLPSSLLNFYKTYNGGATWSISPSLPQYPPVYLKFINANTGFSHDNGLLWNTLDGGATWNNCGSVNHNDYTRIYPDGLAFKIDNNYKIYKSNDFGTNWKMVFENPGHIPVNHIEISDFGLYCAIGSGGLMFSKDEGETWNGTMENYETSILKRTSLFSLHILDSETVIAAGVGSSNDDYVMVKITLK
ncbi:hypothetical protein BH09BAC5_BH09BAC5_28000 [soil metagenome]